MKKKAAVGLLVFLLCTFAFLLVLHTRFVESRVLRYAIRSIERTQNVSIQVESLDYNLFRLRFTLRGVQLRTTAKMDAPSFFRADEVKIRIPVALILGRKFHVQELDIQNLEIHCLIARDGRNNLPFQSLSKSSKGSPTKIPEFIFKHMHVKNASVHILDEKNDLHLDLARLRMMLEGGGKGEHALNLNLEEEGSARFKGVSFPVHELTAKGKLDSSGIDFEELRLRSAENEITMTGGIQNFSSPSLELRIQGELDLKGLQPFLRAGENISGKLGVRSQIQGPIRSLIARVQLQTKEITLGFLKAGSLDAEILWKGQEFLVPFFALKAAGGEIHGTGELHPLESKAKNRLDLKFESLDLAAVSHLLNLPFDLASKISGSFDANWSRYKFDDLQVHGDIQFSAETKKDLSLKPLALSGFARVNLDAGKLSFSTEKLSLPGSILGGEFHISQDRLNGDFDLKVNDLKTIQPYIAQFAGSNTGETLDALDITGQMQLLGTIGGTRRALRIKAGVKSRQMSVLGFQDLQCEGRVQYDSKFLKFESFHVQGGGGAFQISGIYSLINTAPSMRFDVSGNGLSLDWILGSTHIRVPTKANIDFEGHVEGSPENPSLTSSFLFTGASVFSQDFKSVKLSAHYRADEVILDSFRAAKESGEIQGSGRFNLQTQSYQVRLSVDSLRLQDLMFARDFEKISGIMDFHLEGEGLLSFPRFAASGSLKDFAFGERKVGDMSIQVDSTGEELKFQIHAPERTGSINGSMRLGRSFFAASDLFILAKLDSSLINRFFDGINVQGDLNIEAHFHEEISLSGLTASAELSGGRAAFTQPAVAFEDVAFHLSMASGLVKVPRMSFRIGKGLYNFHGEIPLETLPGQLHQFSRIPAPRLANAVLTWKGFDPSVLGKVFDKSLFQRVQGRVDGTASVSGERLQLNNLSGSVRIDALDLDVLDISLHLPDPTQILLETGVLKVPELSLVGKDNRFLVSGSMGLSREGPLDMICDGEIELRMLSSFLKDSTVTGKSLFQIQFTENLKNPRAEGFIEIQNAEMQTAAPALFLTRVNGEMQFDQDKLEIKKFQGELNGGKFSLDGRVDFHDWNALHTRLQLLASNILLDVPKGLHSEITARMTFESDARDHLIAGSVNIYSARYTDYFSVESALYRYFRREAPAALESSEFLNHLQFNVAVTTGQGLFIDNNISKSVLEANLKLTGTVFNPVLTGRAEFQEGGEIYFSRNTFLIESGTIDFINPSQIEPDMNLTTRTHVGEYDIRLLLSGTPDKFSAQFLSDPPLSEPDIVSLMVTGRTLESASASILNVAGNRALSYINSALTGRLEKAAMETFGLESVKIDTSLVALEEDPRARITVGQHLMKNVELVFSQDLMEARSRTWILNYNPVRSINLQGIRNDDNEYSLDVRHELLFGNAKKKDGQIDAHKGGKASLVGKITLEGRRFFPEQKIRGLMKQSEGKKFNFFQFQKDLDRIRKFYIDGDFLNPVIQSERIQDGNRTNLVLHIDSGPKMFLWYQGAEIPKKLKKEIKNILIRGSFGPWAAEEAKQHLLSFFIKKRYFQTKIQTKEFAPKDDEQTLLYLINPGIRFHKVSFHWEGNSSFSKENLTAFLKRNRQVPTLFLNSQKAQKSIETYYQQNGFLQAKVLSIHVKLQPEAGMAEVFLSIEEGPRYKVTQVALEGNKILEENLIRQVVSIQPGQVFSLKKYKESSSKIRAAYVEKGFNHVNVRSRIQLQAEKAAVNLFFTIEENRRGIIQEIEISGNSLTRSSLIRRALKFKEGDPLDFRALGESRKDLYDLGIFERVNVEAIPVDEKRESDVFQQPISSHADAPYRVAVDVVELKPYRLRYGLNFDTETSFGLKEELINRNVFGRALLAGSSLRYNRDERDIRGFIRNPYFFSKKINTELFAFANRMIKPAFTVDRYGFTLQQHVELDKSYILSYNYTFERTHTFNVHFPGLMDFRPLVHIGLLNTAITKDTRDNILNATRGWFLSQSMELAQKFLGSDTKFVRYFGQLYFYTSPKRNFTMASGLRLGLAKGFGRDLIPSERFFAGGSNTVRGFGKDELGPRNPVTGDPVGGDAIFILNQELRFPLYKFLSGVAFVDLGNVYPHVSDFNPFDLRKTAGFGLRIQTPFVLIRFDWGFKLDPKPGESHSKFFLSVGQAF